MNETRDKAVLRDNVGRQTVLSGVVGGSTVATRDHKVCSVAVAVGLTREIERLHDVHADQGVQQTTAAILVPVDSNLVPIS